MVKEHLIFCNINDKKSIINARKKKKKLFEERNKIALQLIKRHIKRQKYILNLFKKDPLLCDLRKAYQSGKQQGYMPSNKDWHFFLHGGCGIQVYNRKTEEFFDFDMLKGGTGGFNAFWMAHYIQGEVKRLALHPKKYLHFVFIDNWETIIKSFIKKGIVKKEKQQSLYSLTKVIK